MKTATASAGRKRAGPKQMRKPPSARAPSKRKAQALKAARDPRIMEHNEKKNEKRSPTSSVRSTGEGRDPRSKPPVELHKLVTNGGGATTAHIANDKAWVAELSRSTAIDEAARAQVVKREGQGTRENDDEVGTGSLKVDDHLAGNGAKLDLAPGTDFHGFPAMEIAMVQWQFWSRAMAAYQRACMQCTLPTIQS